MKVSISDIHRSQMFTQLLNIVLTLILFIMQALFISGVIEEEDETSFVATILVLSGNLLLGISLSIAMCLLFRNMSMLKMDSISEKTRS